MLFFLEQQQYGQRQCGHSDNKFNQQNHANQRKKDVNNCQFHFVLRKLYRQRIRLSWNKQQRFQSSSLFFNSSIKKRNYLTFSV